MNRRRAFCLTGLACALAACGGDASEGDAVRSADANGRSILRVAYEREIDVLNPFTSQNLVDISFSMIEGLITTDENNNYIPVLAKEIPSEANGLITRNADGTVDMTWPLYANVKWHDGEPFTSEDVCFTWKFVTSPGSQTYNREQYLGIEDCLMPDDTTVVFHWNGDYAYYAGLFEAVLPEHVLGELGTEEIVNHEPYNRGAATIGTGPFRFAQWKAGEYIRVVRNDDYWRGDDYPAIDEVVWSFIPDTNTRLNALKSGRYDWGRILPTQVEEAKRLPDYEVHLIESNSFMHFDLSLSTAHGKSLFDDVRVRRGLFHAIDREAIAAQLMQGTVRVAETPIATSSPYHSPEARASTYDPDAAKRLLDETGWTAGADGIRTKNGERMAFTMLNRAGSQDRIAIAQVIQAQLKQIGVEVKYGRQSRA
jgi:peptide/nickel transport system substrate-binding protein